jgi:HK97 family phage prohead protease
MKYDFKGWATKNDLRCSDGRIIRQDAFKDCDGKVVPLVWNHDHNDPNSVLGHALLKNEAEGVRAFCTFNDTAAGRNAKELVRHKDIVALSIYANRLKQRGSEVLHGAIREVSLVLAGANPGAMIDAVLTHGDVSDDEAIIYTGEYLEFGDSFEHSDDSKKKEKPKPDDDPEGKESGVANQGDGKTINDVFNSMTDEQKKVTYFLIGQAIEDAKGGSNDDDVKHFDDDDPYVIGDDMKYNVFDNGSDPNNDGDGSVLSHAESEAIFSDAKRCGSLKDAVLAHGIEDIEWLFPEDKNLNVPPSFIKRDTTWVDVFMSGVHHTPFSRIKSMQANMTEDDARARGYMKGKLKKDQVFSLLKRSTDPQTVYKRQKLDRDDIIDITDFDVVAWIKGEMRGFLNEEIARAALVGDGRLESSDDKISFDHIRPVWTDADLYTIKALMTLPSATTADQKAKAFIRAAIKSRKDYKGKGQPTLFTTEDLLTDMLLLEDLNGRIIYDSEAKLATALRVSRIVTVPVMENLSREVDGVKHNLDGLILNLSDYNIGADKGGAVNMFDDFDIDYNKYTYLIETRCSGAMVTPFGAIAIEDTVSNSANNITLTVGTVTEALIQAHDLGYTQHETKGA